MSSGYLAAIGGVKDNRSRLKLLRRITALAPQQGGVEVAVVAAASETPDDIVPVYIDAFKELGASVVHVLELGRRELADDRSAIEIVERCSIVFFIGGDQRRLVATLAGSALLEALRGRYQAGAVIAGIGAGAIAFPSLMIRRGEAEDALNRGAIETGEGLGLVDGIIFDSHFLERGRFSRLLAASALHPEVVGVGLGEDTGVIVHPNGLLQAFGRWHVIVFDNSRLLRTNLDVVVPGGRFALENVIVHALIDGYSYDPKSLTYLAPPALAQRLGRGASRQPRSVPRTGDRPTPDRFGSARP